MFLMLITGHCGRSWFSPSGHLRGLLRLSVPVGFSFDFPGTSFVGEANLLPSATADWPAGFSAAHITLAENAQRAISRFCQQRSGTDQK